MVAAFSKFREMPGELKGLNPFDAIYGGITTGLTYGLGGGARLLDKMGFSINKKWRPGEKLQILFLAYSGARNTGAEVRVAECIRQVNQVLGADNVDINMTTLDLGEAEEYFKGYDVNLFEFNSIFFKDIFKLALRNHMIVLVEGSCWKENFATALLLYFLYGAGLAHQLGKPCFSYAVDAGPMNKLNNYLSWLLSKDIDRLITRTEDATQVLETIGLSGAVNRVDTAWSMPTETPDWARDRLRELGWDGKKRLIGLAAQNYFWWPVVPDFIRWGRSLVTGDTTNQYKLVYFYDYSKDDEKVFDGFIGELADTMDWVAETYDAQPVIVAMEALDEKACRTAIDRMKHDAILISCNEYDGLQIGAILRQLSLLITTRYHAMVLSMPGSVPFIGLSRDERIRGVMRETGLYEHYYIDYRTEELGKTLRDKIGAIMDDPDEYERVRKVIDANLPYYFAQMSMLGLDIRNLVRECFPGFPLLNLNESDATALIPHIPPDLVARTKRKFRELRKKEDAS